MIAKDIMTRQPKTAHTDLSIRDAIQLMFELDVRHLPIVQRGQLVGIVSDRDLRRFMPRGDSNDGAEELELEELSTSVANLMHTDMLMIHPEMDIKDVVDLLIESKVGALPVVVPNDGSICGIVSYIDVLKAFKEAVLD